MLCNMKEGGDGGSLNAPSNLHLKYLFIILKLKKVKIIVNLVMLDVGYIIPLEFLVINICLASCICKKIKNKIKIIKKIQYVNILETYKKFSIVNNKTK